MTERLKIAFGRQTFPDDARAVWGARLIAPADLLHDRQDLAARNADAKQALIAWLNGEPVGDGAISAMREELVLRRYDVARTSFADELVIYEDEVGKIIGSSQASGGYVYVCGWLK